jgi:hypothetical protein
MSSRSVPVTLDRPRHLQFTFNAFADMQDADPHIFRKDVGMLPVLRRYLWAGLKKEDPTLTEAKVGEILEDWIGDGGDLIGLTKLVVDAVKGSAFSQREKNEASASVPQAVEPPKNSEGNGSSPPNS